MKKQFLYTAGMIVVGICLGLFVFEFIKAIAIPNYSNLLLTTTEQADIAKLNSIGSSYRSSLLLLYLIIGGALFFFQIIFILNPGLIKTLVKKQHMVKAIMIFSFILLMLVAVFFIIHAFISGKLSFVFSLVLFFIVFGAIWSIGGEMGWGGGLKTNILMSFVLGGIFGVVAFLLITLDKWALNQYLILVDNVLDKSSGISTRGLGLLKEAFIVLPGLSFGVLGALLLPLTSAVLEKKQRMKLFLTIFLLRK